MPERDKATTLTLPRPSTPTPPTPPAPPRVWPTPDALRDAVHTVTDLRCYGADWSITELTALCRSDPIRFVEMVATLAALVPVEQPVDTLLSWSLEAAPMTDPALHADAG